MAEWKECRVSEVIDIIGGGTPKTSVSEYWNGNIPWLSVVDFNSGQKYVYKTEKTITDLGLTKSSTKLLNSGDIIISARGTVGAMAMLGTEMTFNQSCYGIRSIEGVSSSHYLFYLLKDAVNRLKQISHGGVFDTITKATFEELKIKLPPLAEQKAIAEVLSSLDDKIDLLHRQNKTLEQMAETLFRQWFVEEADESWESVKLGDLCTKITKGTTPTTLKREFIDSGINFIKVNCITSDGNYLDDKFQYIDAETNDILKRSQLEDGDILYSIAGTIGRVATVNKNILPANVNQALAIIRIDDSKTRKNFIKYCLKSLEITDLLHSKIVHAVQPNLSLGEISNTLLPIRSYDKMMEFDDIINSSEIKIDNNQTQIRTLEAMRDTLLPKLMSGDVRVGELINNRRYYEGFR